MSYLDQQRAALDAEETAALAKVFGWRDMRQGLDAQQASVQPHNRMVVEVTPSCHVLRCSCGVSGPLRPTAEQAWTEADQHPSSGAR